MTRDEVHGLVLSFPETVEGTSYGHPSYKAFGKFLTRLRDDETVVVLSDVGFDEREMLMEARPEVFHLTDHYKNYPYVLARIDGLEEAELRSFLTRRWRKVAPKTWLKKHDAEQR